jgi:hypothetical protein
MLIKIKIPGFYTSEKFIFSIIVHIPNRRRQIVDVSGPFDIDRRSWLLRSGTSPHTARELPA